MKPLSQWTEDELAIATMSNRDKAPECLRELLRRTHNATIRKCAEVCDEVASALTLTPSDDRGYGATVAGDRIRELV